MSGPCRVRVVEFSFYRLPPYRRTKIQAARVLHAADSSHCPPLCGFADAVRATPGTAQRTADILFQLLRFSFDYSVSVHVL